MVLALMGIPIALCHSLLAGWSPCRVQMFPLTSKLRMMRKDACTQQGIKAEKNWQICTITSQTQPVLAFISKELQHHYERLSLPRCHLALWHFMLFLMLCCSTAWGSWQLQGSPQKWLPKLLALIKLGATPGLDDGLKPLLNKLTM